MSPTKKQRARRDAFVLQSLRRINDNALHTALRFPSKLDPADLASESVVDLLTTLDRRPEQLDAPQFRAASFVRLTCKNAFVKFCRRDTAVFVSRHAWDRHSRLRRAYERLRAQLNREPTRGEIAREAKVREPAVDAYLHPAVWNIAPMPFQVAAPRPRDEDAAELARQRAAEWWAVVETHLAPADRSLLRRRIVEGASLCELGRELGIHFTGVPGRLRTIFKKVRRITEAHAPGLVPTLRAA